MIGTVITHGAEFHAQELRSPSSAGPGLAPGPGAPLGAEDDRTIYDSPLYEQRVYEQVLAATVRPGRAAHAIRWTAGRPGDAGAWLPAVVLRGSWANDHPAPANANEPHPGGGILCGTRRDSDVRLAGVAMGGQSAWGGVLASCLRPGTKMVSLVNKRSVLYDQVTFLWRDAQYLGAMLDTVNVTPDGVAIIPDNTAGFVTARNAVLSAGCAYQAITLKAKHSATSRRGAPTWHAGELAVARTSCTPGFDHQAVVLSILTNDDPHGSFPGLDGHAAGVLLATASWPAISSFTAMICSAVPLGATPAPGRLLYDVVQALHARQVCAVGPQIEAQWMHVPTIIDQLQHAQGNDAVPWLLADRWCATDCTPRGVLMEIITAADQLPLGGGLADVEVIMAEQWAGGHDLVAVELWPIGVPAMPAAGRQDTPVVILAGELLCADGLLAPATGIEIMFIFDQGLGLWRQQAVVTITPSRLICGAPQVELPANVMMPQVHFFTAWETHGYTVLQVLQAALTCRSALELRGALLAATTVIWSGTDGGTQQEASAMMTALASCLTSTCAFPATLLPDRVITIERMPIFICYDVQLDYDFEATTSPFDFSLVF